MASPLSSFRRALVTGAAAALGLPADDLASLETQLRVPEAGRGDLLTGMHSLLEIARRANLPFALLRRAADLLCEHQLLRPAKSVGSVASR